MKNQDKPQENPGAEPGKPGFTFGDAPMKDDLPTPPRGPSFTYGDRPAAKIEDGARKGAAPSKPKARPSGSAGVDGANPPRPGPSEEPSGPQASRP